MPILHPEMMISDEQVRRAVEYLRTSDEYLKPATSEADAGSVELVGRVVEQLRDLPDIRVDRVAHGRLLVEAALPSSDELASKLIGRVVSDAIR